MRRAPFVVVAAGLIAILSAACASEPAGVIKRKSKKTGTTTTEDPTSAFGGGGAEEYVPPEGLDPSCAASTNATRAEVDVIFVIDTSGSMDDEIEQVKQNINTFAKSIGNTGLDYNVIMIGRRAPPSPFPLPPGVMLPGLCVPPPLGGANCADGPKYHHLDFEVDSVASLQIILDQYPRYAAWMRPSAYKIFIEVTDDNSSVASADFDTKLLAKAPEQFGDATKRRYIFNSICGYKRGTEVLSPEKCETAMNNGDIYQQVSKLTGGTVDSVCEKSYATVFDNIAKGLVSKLGCDFAYPKAANGQTTDPSTVVVTYTPGDGSGARPLTQVTDASKCGANPDGWFYDAPGAPKKILFCPSTCSGPGADTAGRLDVSVGCDAPPPK